LRKLPKIHQNCVIFVLTGKAGEEEKETKMNTATKTTGHRAKLTFTDSNHSRYFWGAESYKRAVEWVEEQIVIAEAQGLRPQVRILELYV
jgi:hypothetical protein